MKKILINGKEYNHEKIVITIGGVTIDNVSNIQYTEAEIDEIRSHVPYTGMIKAEWTEIFYFDPGTEKKNKERQIKFISKLLTLLHLR